MIFFKPFPYNEVIHYKYCDQTCFSEFCGINRGHKLVLGRADVDKAPVAQGQPHSQPRQFDQQQDFG